MTHTLTPAHDIVRATVVNGGHTVQVGTGYVPASGIMVGTVGHESRIAYGDGWALAVSQYAALHAALLARPDHYLGTWIDGSDLVIDVSIRYSDLDSAILAAIANGQDAVYVLDTGETLETFATAHKLGVTYGPSWQRWNRDSASPWQVFSSWEGSPVGNGRVLEIQHGRRYAFVRDIGGGLWSVSDGFYGSGFRKNGTYTRQGLALADAVAHVTA